MPAKVTVPPEVPPEWKTLVCTSAFGRFVPGDVIDVPLDVTFDTTYFAVKDAE